MSEWSSELPDTPPTPGVTAAPPPGPPIAKAPASSLATPASTSTSTAATSRRGGRGRTILGVLLALLAGISAIGGLASYWATDEILSASTWRSTSSAIVHDTKVQQDVADALAQQIVDRVGVESIVSGVLPGALSGFSGAITDKATELLSAATIYVVRTDAFAKVWENAISATHDQFVHAIDGSGGATTITARGLELDLGGAFDAVKEQLDERGIRVLDSFDTSNFHLSFLLVDAPGLDHLRTWVKALRVAVILLPVVAVLAAIGAFLVARRRAFVVAALGAGGLLGAGIVAMIESAGRARAVDELSGGVIGRSTAGIVVDHIKAGLDGVLLVASAVSLTVMVVGIVMVILSVPRRSPSAGRTDTSLA